MVDKWSDFVDNKCTSSKEAPFGAEIKEESCSPASDKERDILFRSGGSQIPRRDKSIQFYQAKHIVRRSDSPGLVKCGYF